MHALGQALTEFSFYASPTRDSNLVIANCTGAGTTLGKMAYFQQLKLGPPKACATSNLWCFTDKSVVYNNLGLRLKLFDFTSYLLPGTLGWVAFNNVGRVWSPGEAPGKWHDGYGDGLYSLPVFFLASAKYISSPFVNDVCRPCGLVKNALTPGHNFPPAPCCTFPTQMKGA